MQIGHCKEIASWCFKYLPFVRAKYLIWFVWGHMCSELSQELNLTLSLNSAWILPNIGYLVSQNSSGNLCFQSWVIQNCLYASVMFTFMRQIDKAKNKAWMPMSNVSVRFFLILVSLFYVEVSVTRPVFHIWYCTRGFLFRLKIVLPPSWSSYCVPGLLFGIHNSQIIMIVLKSHLDISPCYTPLTQHLIQVPIFHNLTHQIWVLGYHTGVSVAEHLPHTSLNIHQNLTRGHRHHQLYNVHIIYL